MKSRTTAEMLKTSATKGAKVGGIFGLGLGAGVGILASIATPVLTTFWSRWDLTTPTSFPLTRSVPMCAAGGALAGGALGALGGGGIKIATVGVAFFSNKIKPKVAQIAKDSLNTPSKSI